MTGWTSVHDRLDAASRRVLVFHEAEAQALTKDEGQIMNKAPYTKPALKSHGAVRTLTLGAGASNTDGMSMNVVDGNMGM